MSILNREGLEVLEARMRGEETGTLTLSVNFTLCRREGLGLKMKRGLESSDALQLRSGQYT